MFFTTNDFTRVCENKQYLLEVSGLMKEQIDIMKDAITEGKDEEVNTKIKNATLKLEQILVRSTSSVQAESKCDKQTSTVATGEHVPKIITNFKSQSDCKKPQSIVATSETQRKEIEQPPTKHKQDITFIFNILNEHNLQEKAIDIKRIIKKRHLPWLANYIVAKRAMAEMKFQDLYASLLDKLNSNPLNILIITESLQHLKAFLRSIERTSNIKMCMKNLALWLGKLTLAKGRPIPVVDMHILRFVKYHMTKMESIHIPVIVNESQRPTEVVSPGPPSKQTPLLVQQSVAAANLHDDEYICTRSSPEYLATKLNKKSNLVATSSHLNRRIKQNFWNLQREKS